MEQNNTWMRYLQIGIIISLIAVLTSCMDNFFQIIIDVEIINETNYRINFPLLYEKFNVASKSRITVTQVSKSVGKIGSKASDFPSPFYTLNTKDDFIIRFDQTKCLANIKIEDLHSFREIKNFITEKIGENYYKFTYTFTEADYDRAVTCP